MSCTDPDGPAVRRLRHMAATALLALFLPAMAPAQDALAMLPFGEGPKWQAIGRVNAAGFKTRRMCSGTLVAPGRALTAAHCLLREDGTAVPRERLRFVAGLDRGSYAAVSHVAAVALHPDARNAGRIDPRYDIALLTLDQPLTEVTPIGIGRQMAPSVALIGYHRGRPERLSAGFDCPARAMGDLLQVGCPVQPGNSGGPVLAQTDTGWRVIAVVSATSRTGTLAAPVGDWLRAQLSQ